MWANRNLEGVRTYESYDEMLRVEMENGLQAVIIASATTVHAEQAIKAIEMGLHVLCEKPLSTSVEIVSMVCPRLRDLTLIFLLLAVTIRLYCLPQVDKGQPEPESNMRVQPPLRRLLPRCLLEDEVRVDWPPCCLSLADLRQA